MYNLIQQSLIDLGLSIDSNKKSINITMSSPQGDLDEYDMNWMKYLTMGLCIKKFKQLDYELEISIAW